MIPAAILFVLTLVTTTPPTVEVSFDVPYDKARAAEVVRTVLGWLGCTGLDDTPVVEMLDTPVDAPARMRGWCRR